MWILNVETPFANNISERILRSSKTKMKVLGWFSNTKSAEYYAKVKSYIEIGHRYGIRVLYLIEKA